MLNRRNGQPLKVRGIKVIDGQPICGDLYHTCVGVWIKGDEGLHRVHYDSFDLFIAVDANNREVYENDTVIRAASYDDDFDPEKEFPMAATFDDYSAIRDGHIILVTEGKICD